MKSTKHRRRLKEDYIMTKDEKIEKLKEMIDVLNMALEVLENNQSETKETNEKPFWFDKDQVDPRL